ncbi:TonB-dependent receptor domain-containing protein [Psychromonas sp. KJ10-10]|uniref:TonB-dependent receptor domain-containing protein n=1 Tax=Psychromonas sp. KJ10-10 TaxID=3391823 RepID=UPI0039B40111
MKITSLLVVAFEHQELDNSDYIFTNHQWSIFAENEWYITDSFALTAGLRYDNNEKFDSAFSPRLYGVWTVDNNWTIKGGVSTGYRAPSLTEMEQDWVQESCNGNCDIYGNADLKAETSVNVELGTHFVGHDSLMASVTLFYSDFKDKIDTTDIDSDCSARYCDSSYVNIEDAITYGSEVSVSKDIIEGVSLSATYTYAYSEKMSGDDKGQPLTQMPEHLVSANANWVMSDDVSSWLRTSYRSEDNDTTTVSSRNNLAPSITYVDFGGHWQVSKNIKLMVAVYNLFDRETSYAEYNYVEDGRRYWLAFEATF